jgi:hypothetical protein
MCRALESTTYSEMLCCRGGAYRWIDGPRHQSGGVHPAFNDEWQRFFDSVREPTREQVLEHMRRLRGDPRFR